ncbi:MAG: hypothetical protein HYW05_00705 [Candidatus Diapherotrites archaeon]|nr:hypothetical protein [Candidatus Diapherotrites archaeon]
MADVKRVRNESLKAGSGLVKRDRQCARLFKLYRNKLGFSGKEALIKVAQIAENGAVYNSLLQLENEKPLRPVFKSSDTIKDTLREKPRKRKK